MHLPFTASFLPKGNAGSPKAQRLTYIGAQRDLDNLTDDETVIVLGELVIMNLGSAPSYSGDSTMYVAQPTRESRRRDFSLTWFRPSVTHLYASIDPLLAQQIELFQGRSRFVLAVDAMMALVARQPRTDDIIICNGYETPDHTYLDIYVFSCGQLVRSPAESIIKSVDHPRYLADVKQLLDGAIAEFPGARIFWTAPLSPVRLPEYELEYFGSEIYEGKFIPVTHDGRTTPPPPIFPALATGAVIVACLGVGFSDMMSLSQKRDFYDALTRESATAPSLPLEVMQARADWQRQIDSVPLDQILSPAVRILAAIAENPELRVTALTVATQRGNEATEPHAPGLADASPLTVTITAPMFDEQSSTSQAQPIVAELNRQTGLKLVIKPQGINPVPSDGRMALTVSTEPQ